MSNYTNLIDNFNHIHIIIHRKIAKNKVINRVIHIIHRFNVHISTLGWMWQPKTVSQIVKFGRLPKL